MMNGAKKSDSLIIPAKPANKAGHPAAEPVEGSSGTERNAELQSTVRTHGSRVTGAGPHTWSCHQEQEGEAHSAPAPHHGRHPAESVLQTEEARRSRCRRRDMGGLRGRP